MRVSSYVLVLYLGVLFIKVNADKRLSRDESYQDESNDEDIESELHSSFEEEDALKRSQAKSCQCYTSCKECNGSHCFCLNGGSGYCQRGKLSCSCFNGFFGDRCQFPPRNSTGTKFATCTCLNGGSPICSSIGTFIRCRCFNGFYGDICQIRQNSTARPPAPEPTTTVSTPTTARSCYCLPTSCQECKESSCFCLNGASGFCHRGNQTGCLCFNGFSGDRCQFPPKAPPTRKVASCTCLNGGSPICSLKSTCRCFNGFYGDLCQFQPTTTVSTPTTANRCFCFNGGSRVCSWNGQFIRCICFNGFFGNRCQYRPTTTVSTPTTASQSNLRCFRCFGPPGKCRQSMVTCERSAIACFSLQFTLVKNGVRDLESFGCATRSQCLKDICDKLRRTVVVSRCSVNCCVGNFCNRRVSTTLRPVTRPTGKRIDTRFYLKLVLKLLDSFKKMIETMMAMINAYLSSNDARLGKREVVSMMKRVDDASNQLGDSKEPEVLHAKMDVAKTRMRAQKLIKKLDYLIDPTQAKDLEV